MEMLLRALALQPRTNRNAVQQTLARIEDLCLRAFKNNEETEDKTIVVLPEYVIGTPPSEETELYMKELSDLASTHSAIVVAGSYPQLDEASGRYSNFSPIIDSSGKVRGGHYKIQLFRFERKQGMLFGSTVTKWNIEGVEIGQLICSDMWHPELVMQLRDVDVLAVPIMTSVPNKNQTAYARWSWYCLSVTRSKENVVPIIVSDHAEAPWWNDYWTSGASNIVDPSHRFLPDEGPHRRAQVLLPDGSEGWLDLTLDLDKIEEYRKYRMEVGLLGNEH